MRFEFMTAGRIVVGPGSTAELPGLLTSIGRRALLVVGRGATARGGPAAELARRLAESGLVGATFTTGGGNSWSHSMQRRALA